MKRSLLWTAAWVVVVASLFATPMAVPAQPLPMVTASPTLTPEQLAFAEQIGTALREQRLDEALAAITAWERDDTTAGRELTFQRAYWRGAVDLTRGGRAEGSARDALLLAAEQAFQSALVLRPGHDRVANNLASVARLRGDLVSAERWYELAVRAEGLRPEVAAFNAMRYAEFLRDTKRGAEALRWSGRAVELLPEGVSAQALHVELLTAHGGAFELARWLDELRRAGATIFAARSALLALRSLAARPAGERWSLLLVAVAAMARDPALTNAGPGVPQALRDAFTAAPSDGDLAPAIQQLVAQLQQPRPDVSALSAWRSTVADPVTGLSPRSALRMLATTRARDRSDVDRSERWWRVAVELGDRGPDPEAFVGLVAHLSEHGRAGDALPAIMQRYEESLFSLKGSAYNEANWTLVFRMHLALGMAYGALQRWNSNDSPYRNAVFQLDAAVRAAQNANRETDPRRRPSEPLAVPAEGLAVLAAGMRARGEEAKALDVQLVGAERLRDLGRHSEVAAVVRGLSEPVRVGERPPSGAPLSASQQQRLERLLDQLRLR